MPGYFPDHVIAWTENMRSELINLNDIEEGKIHVGGVAHWDNYYKKEIFIQKEALFNSLGLDLNKKTIFYATKSPKRFPWGPNLIEKIAQEIDKGAYNQESQLLVRIHPLHYRRHNTDYIFQEILDEYSRIEKEYDCVILNIPQMNTNEMDFDMEDSEIALVASILKHSDVLINMFSTMAIEAAIFDLPIINMAIREVCKGDIINTKQDIMVDYRQTHNQRIIQSGGCRTAFTMDELSKFINLYFDDPSTDNEGREAISVNEAGPNRGNAASNIGRIINQLL